MHKLIQQGSKNEYDILKIIIISEIVFIHTDNILRELLNILKKKIKNRFNDIHVLLSGYII